MQLDKLAESIKAAQQHGHGPATLLAHEETAEEFPELATAAKTLRRRLRRVVPASGVAFAASTLWA